jgi:AraC-like DNA-binding protein/Flp pilus assembly protein TadD
MIGAILNTTRVSALRREAIGGQFAPDHGAGVQTMPSMPLPRDIHRALNLLNDNPEADHQLAALARACEVTPRTLQRHFQEFLGQSPSGVVRDIRLDRIRRELLLGRSNITVSKLAARFGFNHFGRFSGWYRIRFGETPSATLRRARTPVVAGAQAIVPTIATLDRPKIAVLPFSSVGQPGPASLMSDEIAVALSRRRDLTVTSPHRAEYHIGGKVHAREGDDVRIVVTLRDATCDRLLWADAWTGPQEGTVGFEERVSERVMAKLMATIYHVELDRAWRKEMSDLTVRDLSARALSYALIQDPVSQYKGLEVASKAIERAPDDPLPAALAAQCQIQLWTHTTRHPADREAARARALQTAELRARDPNAEALLAATFIYLRELDAANVHVERALALDGGCAWAWHQAGRILIMRGFPDAGMERLRISQGLDSSGMLRVLRTMSFGFAHFEAGRYHEAIRFWQRALAENPTAGWLNKLLGAAVALQGRKDEARLHLHAMRQFTPGWIFSQSVQAQVLPISDAFNDQLANGWESVGM